MVQFTSGSATFTKRCKHFDHNVKLNTLAVCETWSVFQPIWGFRNFFLTGKCSYFAQLALA